jgi:outer membrane protein TolC
MFNKDLKEKLMTRLMSAALLVFLTRLLFLNCFGADGLTLGQAMNEGLANNPQLKFSSAALLEAEWKKKESFAAYLPKIDIIANHFFDLKYQQIQISPTSVFESTYPVTSYGAQFSLNLFDGMKTTYTNSASQANKEASEFELNHTKMSIENAIHLKYFQALGAQVLAGVAESNVKTLNNHLKRAQDLLRQGEFTKVDVLKIQVQLEQAIPEKLEAEDNAYITRKNLSEVMGIEGDERLLEETLPIPKEHLVKNLNASDTSLTLSKGRLDLKALQKRVESIDELYKASHSFWMPKINLVADYQYYNNHNFTIADSRKFGNAYAVGVNLIWNIFEGGAGLAREEESYFQKIQWEQKALKVKLSSANEVEFWKRKYLNSTILYTAKLRSVDASKESVRIYQNGLRAGTRTNSDLLDAELDLDRSEAGVVKAQVDAVEALLNLELAMGRRL